MICSSSIASSGSGMLIGKISRSGLTVSAATASKRTMRSAPADWASVCTSPGSADEAGRSYVGVMMHVAAGLSRHLSASLSINNTCLPCRASANFSSTFSSGLSCSGLPVLAEESSENQLCSSSDAGSSPDRCSG